MFSSTAASAASIPRAPTRLASKNYPRRIPTPHQGTRGNHKPVCAFTYTRGTFKNPTPWPNPSVEARPNGKPPGPGHRYAVHYLWPGPGVLPSAPPHLER